MKAQEILKPIAGDFEGWFKEQYKMEFLNSVLMRWTLYNFPADFQLGVLLHYFRERWGIIIELRLKWDSEESPKQYWAVIEMLEDYAETELFDDFNTAFSEALTKAVELVKGEVK